MKTIYENLEVQFNKLFRHINVGSFKTRERYGKAFKRFMVFLAKEYHLQKLSNISAKHIIAYTEYMQKRGLSASTIKTELAAIRFFHDNMPYTRNNLPKNCMLNLERRQFGGVDRTWTMGEFNSMVGVTMQNNHNDYAAIFTLARYAGLRLEECFRINTNDAQKAIDTGKLFVKGKGGLTRFVPINESISIVLEKTLTLTPKGQKLFVTPDDKTHLAMKRLQCFISYHRKAFTERRITLHGLRHTYAHEKYDEYIEKGFSEYHARKKVSKLLGHHRDEVTKYILPQMKTIFQMMCIFCIILQTLIREVLLMVEKNKTLVQEYAKEIWLNYFNRVLFEQGIITELQRNEMANLICKECHKKRNA